MPLYKYVGRNEKGKKVTGTMEATSQADLRRQLRAKGISPREMEETKPNIFNRDLQIGGRRVKTEHFVIYCRQFATLIRAGVTISDSTNILAKQTEAKELKRVLHLVELDIKSGTAFSDAAEKHEHVFPELFINMIRAGEMTGNLDDTLDELASYYEKQHQLKKKIQSTLAYPIILSLLIVVVLFFMMIFIIPQFEGIFEQLGGELPALTKIIIGISTYIQNFWWLIVIVLAISIGVFAFFFKKQPKFHYTVHLMLLKMPIFGKLLQKTAIARLTRTLASLFASAVPILEALKIVAKVADNPIITKVVLEARTSLESGSTLADPLKKHWVFPPLVYQMIEIGEQTGALDYMLDKIADFYEEDVDRTVDTLQSLIEPIMIVLLAAVVGIIVLAVMIPMFSVFTEIQ